ncbi:MAG: hypothetical protein C0459_13985 [Chitinophaga sp.]|jgi:hypothetical protein|nr:hypothetical protein [Chitinophaga sp.]
MKILKVILISAIFITSCKKDTLSSYISLPEQTVVGNNTFGFLYNNGIVWNNVRIKPGILINTLSIDTLMTCFYYKQTSYYKDFLGLFASMQIMDNNFNYVQTSDVQIKLVSPFQPNNTFLFDTSVTSNKILFSLKQGSYANYIKTFNLTIIKRDTINKIISGYFNGTLFNSKTDSSNLNKIIFNLKDSLIISDGRFDVKYY